MVNHKDCVLAVDPGIKSTGVAVLQKDERRWRFVMSSVHTTPSNVSPPERLRLIWKVLKRIVEQTQPSAIAVEDQAGPQEGHRRSGDTSAIALWGRDVATVVRAIGWERDIRVIEVTAAQAKKAATGNGRATKTQVVRAMQMQLGVQQLSAHEADACAIGIAAQRLAGTHLPPDLARRIPGKPRVERSKRKQLQEIEGR